MTEENWMDVFLKTVRQLEDGDISYCTAIDRIENCKGFPPLAKAGIIKEWSLKGCP